MQIINHALFLYKQIPWRLAVVLERWPPLASRRKSGRGRRTASTNNWLSTSSDSHSASGSLKSCHGNCWCQGIQTLCCKFSTIPCKWKWKFMLMEHTTECVAMWYLGSNGHSVVVFLQVFKILLHLLCIWCTSLEVIYFWNSQTNSTKILV